MTIELCRFSFQEVFCDWRLAILFCLLLLMLLALLCAMVSGIIIGFRVMKMILHREIDMQSAVFDNQKFISGLLKSDSVRGVFVKGFKCILAALVIGIIATLYSVISVCP